MDQMALMPLIQLADWPGSKQECLLVREVGLMCLSTHYSWELIILLSHLRLTWVLRFCIIDING